MSRARGVTLVEVMITIAVMGISGGTLLHASGAMQRAATDRLDQERASQLLDYEARELSEGRTPDPAVERALTAALHSAALERERAGRLTTLRVSWKYGSFAHTRALSVFTPGAR